MSATGSTGPSRGGIRSETDAERFPASVAPGRRTFGGAESKINAWTTHLISADRSTK